MEHVGEGFTSGDGVAVDIADVVTVRVEDLRGAAGPAADEFFGGFGVVDDVVDAFGWC